MPTRNAGDATTAIQPKTVIQPWTRPQNAGGPQPFGAYRADQRYWAPTVGLMDAISAIEAATSRLPTQQSMVPYTREVCIG